MIDDSKHSNTTHTYSTFLVNTSIEQTNQVWLNKGILYKGIIIKLVNLLSPRFCFAKNCFISGIFTHVEWNVYCDWHRFLADTLPLHFDGFIYLRADPKVVLCFVMCNDIMICSELHFQVCYERLQKRKRPEVRIKTLYGRNSLKVRTF